MKTPSLNDDDFLRYSRQLLLEEIGLEGQAKLQHSSVLIIGLGGLGSPAALYLAAAGVGQLLISDGDVVEPGNLQRQILFNTDDLAQCKTDRALKKLCDLNRNITIKALKGHLSGDRLREAAKNADLVLDCSDNMSTRHDINAVCIQTKTPLISGSALGFSGQLMVMVPPYLHGCYACLYPDKTLPHHNCRTAGILGPVVGVIGSLQALEALKMLLGLPSALTEKLYLFDAKNLFWNILQRTRSEHCPVCSH